MHVGQLIFFFHGKHSAKLKQVAHHTIFIVYSSPKSQRLPKMVIGLFKVALFQIYTAQPIVSLCHTILKIVFGMNIKCIADIGMGFVQPPGFHL